MGPERDSEMTCKVLTISRTLGAGGEEIGFAAAMELGFRYADEEIILRAAERAGVSPQTVAAAEHTPGLMARILEGMARTPPAPEGIAYAAWAGETAPAYEELIERVIRETAAEGDVVIVAHAASFPLSGTEGVFRVLITAPADVRTARLMKGGGMTEKDARKAVVESDRQRREYLRRFYGVSEELPIHFDLVLNTDNLPIQAAAELLIAGAKAV